MDDAIGNYQRSNDHYEHRSITVGNEVIRMIDMMPTPELAGAMGRLGLLLLLPETDASVGAQYPVPPPPPGGVACAFCRSADGISRNHYRMAPQGQWAGLAEGARVVCTLCYRTPLGRIESALPRQR